MKKYYLYEVNVNPSFDWKDWRIVLYSERDNVAARINFSFKGDEDVANPHISSFGGSQSDGSYVFYLTFFLRLRKELNQELEQEKWELW